MCKWNNTLNKQWISREIRIYSEINENEYMTYWDEDKAVINGQFTAVSTSIKKRRKSSNNLAFWVKLNTS
jgi:hypothetical protein